MHSITVAQITEAMLQYNECAQITRFDKGEVITGALLHDIGKAFLPFNLSAYPGRLSHEEMGIIKTHAYIGHVILKESFSDIVCNIALMHHERLNGSGYPEALQQNEIPEYVTLVQVADIFDALTRRRNYKDAYNIKKALGIMSEECEKYKIDKKYLSILKQIYN